MTAALTSKFSDFVPARTVGIDQWLLVSAGTLLAFGMVMVASSAKLPASICLIMACFM